ncbi:hypothetical protein ER308_08755 [Egibacter rhizosphaerae]|uniref:Uncharacterized protein n=1 Tax=Egibacter rhizosphaerae TaxID=1670831 RepID=A0A411YET5_9ACTN|nr:hypothetical protein ER308_08755 [Egibacter rhizosphaerae]
MDPATTAPPNSGPPLHPDRDDDWVDELLGYEGPPDYTVAALRELRLRDDGADVWLGALDQVLAALTCWLARLRVRHGATAALHVQLPRGAHEVAAMLGIFAQLARLRSTLDGARREPPFHGSVTVIGMDSALQRRLRRVSLHNVGLAEGLAVHRVRSDGQLVDPSGAIVPYRVGRQRMLYLNTRVGYPPCRASATGWWSSIAPPSATPTCARGRLTGQRRTRRAGWSWSATSATARPPAWSTSAARSCRTGR